MAKDRAAKRHRDATPQERTCVDCDSSFTTKNNSTRCSSCQYRRTRALNDNRCPKCNTVIDKRAAHCTGCQTRNPRNTREVGERYVHPKTGYVDVKTEDGWVREHTLVMERHLGRPLVEGENVHHRNGVRSDNRLDNLELWVVQQPAGQRAADLLAWAKVILDRYDGVDLD